MVTPCDEPVGAACSFWWGRCLLAVLCVFTPRSRALLEVAVQFALA